MTEARPVEVRFGEDAGPSRTGISSRRDAYAAPNRLHLWVLLVLILSLISTFTVDTAAASLKFGAVPFSPGSTVRANVPMSPQEKSYAAQGGNPVPANAVAVLATPSNFDPTKSWPVLVICSTSDFKRQNRDDLADFYRRVGLSEGWVLLAGDGPQHAKNDNVAWRESMTMATGAFPVRRSGRSHARGSPGEEKALVTLRLFSLETIAMSSEFISPVRMKTT